jgi:cell division protein FtsB
MQLSTQTLRKWIANKYFLTTLLFTVWMLFFDQHNLFTRNALNRTCSELIEEKKFYESEIAVLEDQKTNFEENLEEIAREEYFLKKKEEDVFIIRDKKKN